MMVLGAGVKAAAAVGLTGGSYLTGTIPSCLGLGRECGQSLTLSLVLCFGGGVLFATAIVHVLPEARDVLPDWADAIFCCGFMLLYLIDELIKLFETRNEKVHCQVEVKGLLDRTVHHRYGTTCDHEHQEQLEEEGDQNQSEELSIKISPMKNRAGLVVAFSVHSIIEGVVIGVQPVPGKVMLLLTAVSSHKLVVAFCLGAELASDGRSFMSLSQSMLVYSFGSTVGIVLGMFVERTTITIASIPILQALAAGSLLYVTVSEVLPRERSRWEHQSLHPSAGILQYFFFFLGFSVIASLLLIK